MNRPVRDGLAWMAVMAVAGCVALQPAPGSVARSVPATQTPPITIVSNVPELEISSDGPRSPVGDGVTTYPAGKGRILIAVKWPDRKSQAIPSEASAIVVKASQGQSEVGSTTIVRPASSGQLFLDDVTGLTVVARAYAQTNPSGSDAVLAQGSTSGINVTSGQDTPVTITLGAVPEPSISSVTPPDAGPGAQVRITGANLGVDTGAPYSLMLTGGFSPVDLSATGFPSRTASGSVHYIDFMLPGTGNGKVLEVTVNGKTATSSFTVLASLMISPAAATVAVGGTKAFTAAATASDGVTSVSNPTVQWGLMAPPGFTGMLFDIANIGLTTGQATGVAAGTVWVRASSGQLTSTASLTVQ